MNDDKRVIGYACSYTPQAIIDAAGFKPYRILPVGDNPDQAGRILHDNLCPHVKKILDKCLSGDIPDLHGMVFMNSCDAMRRLYDAWSKARPGDNNILIDLPAVTSKRSLEFFSNELIRLIEALSKWSGSEVTDEKITSSIKKYNELNSLLSELRIKVECNNTPIDALKLQDIYNKVQTTDVGDAIDLVRTSINSPEAVGDQDKGIPVFLFGNVLPDTEVFSLLKECGARVISDDLCTGSRSVSFFDLSGDGPLTIKLANGILNRPPCARTFKAENPGSISMEILERAKELGAKGVIGHTVKFCDPYLNRIPGIRDTLKKEGMPFLFLEGDCTIRSIGQQRTRIEAFIEMLD